MTSHTEFTRKRSSKIALTAASSAVVMSTTAARANTSVTTAISASDPTMTPSRNAPAAGERRRRGTSGPLIATKKKDGRKIPAVATTAPGTPPSR